MKLCLMGIIAPWDEPYLSEWLDYHFALGFDCAWLMFNDWWWKPPERFEDKVKCFTIYGTRKQVPSYNWAIRHLLDDTDVNWVAVLDGDEFLKIRSARSLKVILRDYSKWPSLAVNWLLHGDAGLATLSDSRQRDENGATQALFPFYDKVPVSPTEASYGVLRRFTKCDTELNQHVKQLVNLSVYRKFGACPIFTNPHCLEIPSMNLENHPVVGPFNREALDKVHELEVSHYFCKTKEEFLIRRRQRRADAGTPRPDNLDDLFAAHNKNQMNERERIYA